jgi:hypothetical protein
MCGEALYIRSRVVPRLRASHPVRPSLESLAVSAPLSRIEDQVVWQRASRRRLPQRRKSVDREHLKRSRSIRDPRKPPLFQRHSVLSGLQSTLLVLYTPVLRLWRDRPLLGPYCTFRVGCQMGVFQLAVTKPTLEGMQIPTVRSLTREKTSRDGARPRQQSRSRK